MYQVYLKKIIYLFFSLSLYCSFSQEQNSVEIDSLRKLSLSQLVDEFYEKLDTDKEKAKVYADIILEKYKKTEVPIDIVNAYELMAYFYSDNLEKRIAYLDSAITHSKEVTDKNYPTVLFVNKGAEYANHALFNDALENYLEGLNYAKQKNDSLYEYVIYHNIALLKRKIGKYRESKNLLKKCLKYEKSKIKKTQPITNSYLETLVELVTTFRRNKENDSARIFNDQGLKISGGKPINCLFNLNDGILDYYKENYYKSIIKIEKALNEISKPNNFYLAEHYNIIDGYFYLGKANEAIQNEDSALLYYKKIDSLIDSTNYLIPEVRLLYSKIIEHYKVKEDLNNQLYYIKRLIKYDSILDKNLVDLNINLINDYDTPNLIKEKERLINSLKNKGKKSNNYLFIALIGISIFFLLFVINYRKKNKYKLRFEDLMKLNEQENEVSIQKKVIPEIEISLDISQVVVDKILLNLNTFEKNNGFTQINLTSVVLAKQIETNSKYLTKVIKHYKQKSFIAYINDLRIDYIINRLKRDHKLRNYTIKALAKEAGFNSAEVFSKCFFKKTGIYPSYFVKRIQANENQ